MGTGSSGFFVGFGRGLSAGSSAFSSFTLRLGAWPGLSLACSRTEEASRRREEIATRGAMRDVGNARAAAVTRVRRTPAVRGTAIAAPRATVIVVMTASIVSTDSIDADKGL